MCPARDSDAARVVQALGAVARTVSVAESLTGGAVTEAIVAVPGASRCLRGGVVAYATDLKAELLGVDPDLLRRHGAVHPEVARAMARGVRERLRADYGLATTGVAGPDHQDGQPPGVFHVAVEGPWGGEVVSHGDSPPQGRHAGPVPEPRGSGTPSRSAVRAAARDAALRLLERRVVQDAAAHAAGR